MQFRAPHKWDEIPPKIKELKHPALKHISSLTQVGSVEQRVQDTNGEGGGEVVSELGTSVSKW